MTVVGGGNDNYERDGRLLGAVPLTVFPSFGRLPTRPAAHPQSLLRKLPKDQAGVLTPEPESVG